MHSECPSYLQENLWIFVQTAQKAVKYGYKTQTMKSLIDAIPYGWLLLFAVTNCMVFSSYATLPDTVKSPVPRNVSDKEKVEMVIVGFSDFGSSAYTVFLKEADADNDIYLPIVIGSCEAMSLSREMAEVDIGRPLTYQLFSNLLNKMQVELEQVIITTLKDNTFYAVMVFKQGSSYWQLDARPSDALNMAVRMKSKVYSYRDVIDTAGQEITK